MDKLRLRLRLGPCCFLEKPLDVYYAAAEVCVGEKQLGRVTKRGIIDSWFFFVWLTILSCDEFKPSPPSVRNKSAKDEDGDVIACWPRVISDVCALQNFQGSTSGSRTWWNFDRRHGGDAMGNFVSDWLAGWRLEILCCVIVECRMFANRIGSTCLD